MKYYFKCPNCGCDDEFSLPKEQSSGLGCLLFFLGGIIPALLYANSTQHRVQCSECGYIFRKPPFPRTPLSVFTGWIIGIIVVFGVFTSILFASPDVKYLFPYSPTLMALERIIASNPYAIIFGILPMIALIFILAIFVSIFSNYKAQRALNERYETEPK